MIATDDSTGPTRTALVLYGTETGTAQDLALETSRALERQHFITDIDEFDNVYLQGLAPYTLVVFVIATTGQGEFPSNSRRFWKTLLLKRLTSTFFSGLNYALVGLGDTSYPKFNLAARKLDKRLSQLGANRVLQPCEADEQGEDSTDGAFLNWLRLFKICIAELHPLPHGLSLIPESEPIKSRWTLSQVESSDTLQDGNNLTEHLAKSASLLFNVTLEQNNRITPTEHWQDVRFLKLRADRDVFYAPGDALAIRPKNMPDDVQQLIELMQWDEIADKNLRVSLNSTSIRPQRLPDSSLTDLESFTLRQLLTSHLDINAIPRRSFFAAIANFTTDEMQRDRLREFTDPQYLDEYYDYATRPRRSILEILQEFHTVKIPWQEAINVFPILRARQFSIASNYTPSSTDTDAGTTFDLLVAIVKYRTVIKRIRQGICTRYLATLPVDTTLSVTLNRGGRFHKPDQLVSTRHLLVGAGTGIAPLRSLIHSKHTASPPTTLIFGCRSADADYFFRDEWEALSVNNPAPTGQSGPTLQVLTAFSRDQKQKFYVQDRIRNNPQVVRDHLLDPTSTVIICGSSGAMPKAVRQAFVDVLSSGEDSGMTAADAELFLTKMEKDGRYKQETW